MKRLTLCILARTEDGVDGGRAVMGTSCQGHMPPLPRHEKKPDQAEKRPGPSPRASVSVALASLYQRRRRHAAIFVFCAATVWRREGSSPALPPPRFTQPLCLCEKKESEKRKEKTAKVKSAESTSQSSGERPALRRRPPHRLARISCSCRSTLPLVTSPRP